MKKLLLLLLTLLMLQSCVVPVLEKDEYTIIDTLAISKNGFGVTLGYEVIISIDSVYHYGRINNDGTLTYVSPRKLKLR